MMFSVMASVADRLKHEQSLDERLKNEFMLQQLVNLVSSLDLSDEVARSVVSPLFASVAYQRLQLVLHCAPASQVSFSASAQFVNGRVSGL